MTTAQGSVEEFKVSSTISTISTWAENGWILDGPPNLKERIKHVYFCTARHTYSVVRDHHLFRGYVLRVHAFQNLAFLCF